MKAIKQFFTALFILAAALGYVYFGPPEQTAFVSDTAFYRMYLLPVLDRLMAMSGTESSAIGYVANLTGQLEYRPPSELVSLPARKNQSLVRQTLVSSGPKSGAIIRFNDHSQLTLEENSVVLLDMQTQVGELPSLTLKVMKGSVVAEKAKDSKSEVRVVSSKGIIKSVASGDKIAVVGARKINPATLTKQTPDAAREIGTETEEFIGPVTSIESPADIEGKLAAEKAAKLAEKQKALEEKALAEEESRQATMEAQPLAPAKVESRSLAATDAAPGKAQDAKDGGRSPASIAPMIEEGPEVINHRRAAKTAKWKAPPETNHLSRAIYAKKLGRSLESGRYMALSLTNVGYIGAHFNDATRLAVDDLMQGYIDGKNCRQASDMLRNIATKYSGDPVAQEWAQSWKTRISRSSCL